MNFSSNRRDSSSLGTNIDQPTNQSVHSALPVATGNETISKTATYPTITIKSVRCHEIITSEDDDPIPFDISTTPTVLKSILVTNRTTSFDPTSTS